jgi:hypothetical protein
MMDAFLEVLVWVWIILGFFLIPFNVQISLLYCPEVLGISGDTWQVWRKRAWVVQMAWNPLFFGLGIGNTLVHQATDRVTFSREPSGGYSDWKFYRNGKLIDDDADDATPFQKACVNSISHNPFGKNADFKLDPEGLNESNPENYAVAFDKLSEEEARAYIKKYNREHSDLGNPFTIPLYLLTWFGFSVAAPFWPMVFEALGIIAVLFPGLFLFCFGPMIWAVMRSLGFIGWVTSLFHDI